MRSFAVIAGLAAAANAQYGYGAAPVNSTSVAPAYGASSAPAYAVSSAPVVYATPSSYVTTKVISGLSVACSTPATLTYGSKTYTVKGPTTIIDTACVYTPSSMVKPTPTPVYATSAGVWASSGVPAKSWSAAVPAGSSVAPVVPYPSAAGKNGTTPYATGAKASSTTGSPAQYTGAAAQAGVGLMAVIGAVAAFL